MTHRVFITALAIGCAAGLSLPAHAQSGLRVALDGTFAPHAMPSLSGGIEGFNVDMAELIAERLGTTIQIDAAQFSGLIPAMQAGTYDFLVAPVTVSAERAENMLFTEGFMDTNFSFVQMAGTEAGDTLEGYRGQTISVNKGSAYEEYLNKNAAEYDITVTGYGTATDAVEAVLTGRAFASLAGSTVAAWAVQKNPRLELGAEIGTGLVWALPFRKDDVENRNKVDAVLECLKTDGSLAALSEKWFGVTPAEGSTIVTPVAGYGTPGFPGYEDTPHGVTCDFAS
ncbi:transporter substrate-binding domain-containing protein [Falsirhodobacter halotolerans]|uniref:transporter substrate-binding domain-containing protein n=1 Tax=Falsirhodobacter halotolerans TaxID=1146892 RepID=UPI001FD498B1|nr:transporter substrate-binding domain-containing protein [Falsirhodobacter halotolerans]MCJ8141218.1 transporter substrate-binding domain-containing protein [Falsirhodobacter halotolerans]